MKALVFLLVLANLLFYAFGAGYFGRPDNPDAGRVEQQVMPERMRIVSRGEAPAAPAKPAPAAENAKPEEVPPAPAKEEAEQTEPVPPPDKEAQADKTPVCLSWHQLSAADAERVSAVLAKRFAAYQLTRQVVAAEGNGWWVAIPPLPGKAEADKKAGQLRGLGVNDFFIVQDGPSRLAISLGVFSTEKGGQDKLAELKAKGVRSALVGPRPGKDSTITLQARGPAGQKAALLGAVGEALPKAEDQGCQ